MSLNSCNASVLSSRVKLKTIVGESRTSSERSEKSEKRETSNRDDDVKINDDDVVKRDNEKCRSTVKNRRSTPEKDRYVTSGRDRDKTRESRKHDKVTANSILKAVEASDMKYLEQNVTPLNVNICDDYGWTPLMSAAFSGNYNIIDFLLKLGANPKCRDKSGFTAAGLASKKNYSGIVALLREKQSTGSSETSRNFNPRKDPQMNHRRRRNYCTVCKESFRESTLEKHEATTLHIFNSRPQLADPSYAIPKQNKQYQMLLNRGWREDGSGHDADEMKYPMKNVLKRDHTGLDTDRKDGSRAVETSRSHSGDDVPRKRDREKILCRESSGERAVRPELS